MHRKIRILYTIPNFGTAGSQYVLLSLYRRLDREVFDPYICVESNPDLVPEDISEDRQLLFNWTGNKIQDIWKFRALLKKHEINVVHSWDYKSNYTEAFATRTASVKYLYTKKNNTWTRPWKVKSLFSNHIAYDNPEMKNRFFNSIFLTNKISFIPHGVDTAVFKPLEKIQSETYNIGCIGNINSNKNQLFIVKALKSLPSNIHLHLYGNEDKIYRKKMDVYILSEFLSDRVHFYGFIANEAIPHIYKNLDVMVLASLQEGFPVSILEAMACGVPVLSSDSGGGAKYLLDSNYLFSLDRVDDLRDKILKFYKMDISDLEILKREGRSRICRELSSQREVSEYEKLYEKMVKS